MFNELRAVSTTQDAGQAVPDWMKMGLLDDSADQEPMEEERSWRDPSAHKLRSAVGMWQKADHQRAEIINVSDIRLF